MHVKTRQMKNCIAAAPLASDSEANGFVRSIPLYATYAAIIGGIRQASKSMKILRILHLLLFSYNFVNLDSTKYHRCCPQDHCPLLSCGHNPFLFNRIISRAIGQYHPSADGNPYDKGYNSNHYRPIRAKQTKMTPHNASLSVETGNYREAV